MTIAIEDGGAAPSVSVDTSPGRAAGDEALDGGAAPGAPAAPAPLPAEGASPAPEDAGEPPAWLVEMIEQIAAEAVDGTGPSGDTDAGAAPPR